MFAIPIPGPLCHPSLFFMLLSIKSKITSYLPSSIPSSPIQPPMSTILTNMTHYVWTTQIHKYKQNNIGWNIAIFTKIYMKNPPSVEGKNFNATANKIYYKYNSYYNRFLSSTISKNLRYTLIGGKYSDYPIRCLDRFLWKSSVCFSGQSTMVKADKSEG